MSRRTSVLVIACVLAAFAAAAVRTVHEGRAALREGDEWMLRGKPARAAFSYEAAARWYLPFAPHVADAYDKLRDLTADPTVALAAWRAIRSAALATRTFWQPHARDLADADTAIADAEAADPRAGAGAGDTTRARVAWYRARLEPVGPHEPAIALAVLGIALWLGGAIALVRRGVDGAGQPIRTPARRALAVIATGLALWALGLYLA